MKSVLKIVILAVLIQGDFILDKKIYLKKWTLTLHQLKNKTVKL